MRTIVWAGPEGGWIYALQEVATPLVKIGFTRLPYPRDRAKALSKSLNSVLQPIGFVYVSAWVRKVEMAIHASLDSQRIEREWFYLHLSSPAFFQLVSSAVTHVEGMRQARQRREACMIVHNRSPYATS